MIFGLCFCLLARDLRRLGRQRMVDEESEMMELGFADDEVLNRGHQVPLLQGDQPVRGVREDGVAVIGKVLSRKLAETTRDVVLTTMGPRSSVLNPRRKKGAEETRIDRRLPLQGVIEEALAEIFTHLGDPIAALATPDAELYELAAFIAKPGAGPQIIHGDTLWDPAPCLYTALIALQDIPDLAHGPTRFIKGSHTNSELQDRIDDNRNAALLAQPESSLALLNVGDACLYDGRILHAGTPNDSLITRVLLYFTFRHPDGDADDLGNPDAHSILPDLRRRGLRLRDFLPP